MQEETTQKTIALAIKTSKLTASVLQKAMKMYLEHQKHKEPSHGKIPVKKLVGQGEGAKSIEVTDSNIKSFERVAFSLGDEKGFEYLAGQHGLHQSAGHQHELLRRGKPADAEIRLHSLHVRADCRRQGRLAAG